MTSRRSRLRWLPVGRRETALCIRTWSRRRAGSASGGVVSRGMNTAPPSEIGRGSGKAAARSARDAPQRPRLRLSRIPRNGSARDAYFYIVAITMRLEKVVTENAKRKAVSKGGFRSAAAGGRRRQTGIPAAVEKCKEQRKPDAFFGHRKAGMTSPAEIEGKGTGREVSRNSAAGA